MQRDGGYAADDGKWSHAAMYLGDQENVVEATFDDIYSGGSVRITSIDEYSDGRYALRFRRPRKVTSESDGWKLCVRALSRLRQPYAFTQAAKLWWDVVIRKSGFYSGRNQRTTSEAVICSTLSADSYNWATVAANRIDLGWFLGGNIPIHGAVGGSRVWQASVPRARLLEGRKNAGLLWR